MHKILPTQIFNKETTTFILDSEDILLCENFFEYQAKQIDLIKSIEDSIHEEEKEVGSKIANKYGIHCIHINKDSLPLVEKIL